MGQSESRETSVTARPPSVSQSNVVSRKERKKEIKAMRRHTMRALSSSSLPPRPPSQRVDSPPPHPRNSSSRNYSASAPPFPFSSSPLTMPLHYNPRLTRATSSPSFSRGPTGIDSGRFMMKESALRSVLEEMGFSRAVVADVLESITPPPEPGRKRAVVDPNSLIERLMEETRRRFGDVAIAELTTSAPESAPAPISDEHSLDNLLDDSGPTSTTITTTTTTSTTSTPTGNGYINPFLLPEGELKQRTHSETTANDYQNPFEQNDDNKCKICLDKPIDTVILRCGHLAICFTCSKRGLKKCPICRRHITEIVRIFHA